MRFATPGATARGRMHAALLLLAIAVVLPAVAAPAHAQEPPPEDAAETTTTTAAQEGGPALHGTLRQDGEPVEGVRIVVTDGQGNRVGTAVTGEDGRWRVVVPSPGEYRVTLVTDTLPEGVSLRREGDNTRTLEVRPGQERIVLFPFGEREQLGPSFWERFAQASLNGVKLGLLIAMAAVGLALVFGTTGLVNFAHGELVTFGAVVAWYFNASSPELHLVVATLVTLAIAAGFGAGLELGLWRPLRRHRVGLFQMLVISIGLALLVRHVILIFFGGRSRPFVDFTIQQEMELGPFSITPRDLTIMVLSLVILAAVAAALRTTKMGKAMRAVSDNPDLAESSGIDVRRVILTVWVTGTALAALGGIFFGAVERVQWNMGFNLLLLMFAGVILGGLGNAYGALVGSLVVGLGTELSTVWFSNELRVAWALVILILVLLFRPQGILGVRERVG